MRVYIQPFSLLDYYLTSVWIGLRSLPGHYSRDAAARIINPLSYPRYMEYELTLNQLELDGGCRVLDIGSPKLPTLLLARNTRCELYSTDIRDYFIGSTAHFLTRAGLGHRLGDDVHLETQDARALSYPGGFLTLTVPFRAQGYAEEYVDGDVYERQGNQGQTFYQRHYDRDALTRRL